MSKPGTLGSSSLPSVLLLRWLTAFFILLCSRHNHHSVIPKSEWHLPEISVLLSTGFGYDNFESFRKSLMNWDLETQRSSTLLLPPSVAKYVFTHHLLCARYSAAWWETFFKKNLLFSFSVWTLHHRDTTMVLNDSCSCLFYGWELPTCKGEKGWPGIARAGQPLCPFLY